MPGDLRVLRRLGVRLSQAGAAGDRPWGEPWRIAALGAVVLFHLGSILVGPEPGALSVDERTYWWMTESLVEGGGLAIANGYEERPSPELVAAAVVVRDGRLVPSPPILFPALAAPLYLAFGFQGLFVLNTLGVAASLALTFGLARALELDRKTALDAALVLGLATYLGDYAQAAWPHAVATAFVVAAAWAALRGERADRSAERWSFASGLLAALGLCVRLDLVLLVPVVVAAPLCGQRPDRRRSFLAAVGCVPGLTLLAWTNWLKFGSWSPLSYGVEGAARVSGVLEYVPIAALGLSVAGIAGLALGARRLPLTLRTSVAGVAAVGLLVWPTSRHALAGWASGLWQLLVDLRARDSAAVEPVLTRGPGGSLVYLGAVKKALLQSCPYLSLLLFADLPRDGSRRLVLLGTPALFVALYAAFAWHGGLALNLRYWTPVLPFAALATAVCLARLGRGGRISAAGIAIAVLVGLATVAASRPGVEAQEAVYLTGPLVLTTLLGLAAVAARGMAGAPAAQGSARALAAAGLAWAAGVAFTWDLPHAMGWRRANAAVTRETAAHVPAGALFATPYLEPFFGLIEREVLLADPTRDGYADFPALARFHLEHGRPVLAAFRAEVWEELLARGHLDGLAVEMLLRRPHFELGRLSLAP